MNRYIPMLGMLCLLANAAGCAEGSELDRTLEDTPALRAALTVDGSPASSADSPRTSPPVGEPCGDTLCSENGRCVATRGVPPYCVPRLPSDYTIVCPEGYRRVGGGDTQILCNPSPDLVHGKTCADAPCGPNTQCEDHENFFDHEAFVYCSPLLPVHLICDYVRCGPGYVCVDGIVPTCILPPSVTNDKP